MNKAKVKNTWQKSRIGETNIANISSGGTPRRSIHRYFQGEIPWAKIGDLTTSGKYISDTEEKISEEAIEKSAAKILPHGTVLVSMYGSIGKASITLVPMATNQAILSIQVNSRIVLNEYLYYFLLSVQPQLEALGRGATQNNINAGHIKNFVIPIPPIPVQEHIVQILQKADEICQKRKEALELIESIIYSCFQELFGDPVENPKDWPVVQMSEMINDGIYGTSKTLDKYGEGIPVLRMNNITYSGYFDYTDLKMVKLEEQDISLLKLLKGDILFNRTNSKELVGKTGIFDGSFDCVPASYLIRFRVNPKKATPEYIWAFLNSKRGKELLYNMAKGAVNQSNINKTDFLSIFLPKPPLNIQAFFTIFAKFSCEIRTMFRSTLIKATNTFLSLLDRTFTGELTAEWEKANASWIQAQVELRERLPYLLLLAFIRQYTADGEKTAQASILVTALMKYTFLFQMEGGSRHRFYKFIPYHYGPFAKEVYTDLEYLQSNNLITINKETDENKTYIEITDTSKADAILSDLPEDLKENVTNIMNIYGELDYNSLLKKVYEKYPEYTKKSRLKKISKNNLKG